MPYALGLDFGTLSARAVLVDTATGDVTATAVHAYADGVIDQVLPGEDVALPPDWALQRPGDWLTSMTHATRTVLAESGVAPGAIVGLGIDFTACTVLPTTAGGTPLCEVDRYRTEPHAWPKLWKHHAAQPQADRINEVAADRGEAWLARYGGKLSSEWLLPKALQILDEHPALYAAADRIVEGADWVAWQLTGTLARNACCAGYKGTWHKADGYPAPAFLAALHPDFATLYTEKVAEPVVAPGTRIGGLTAAWAERLGLPPGTPVAAPIIDAHAATLGGGVDGPSTLFMIMGTSTCHLLMDEREVLAEGIAGVVEDGILPGLFGYEAGQAGSGDLLAWFTETSVPPAYHAEAERRGVSLHEVLTDRAAALAPGETGLLALDWWNGNRSTLVDASLSGLLIGATLGTTPEDIYRAFVEATAFGTRAIIEAFTDEGIAVDALIAGGSLTQNAMLMQIYADVTGRPIAVTGSEQVSALGAAMLGAVAGAAHPSLAAAVAAMAPPPARTYVPIQDHEPVYDALYAEYRRLYNDFGRGENPVMKTLRTLRGHGS